MFNEIEETIVTILNDANIGLPGDNTQSWFVPAAQVARKQPDLQRNLKTVLPAVSIDLSEFSIGKSLFSGIGEIEKSKSGINEIDKLIFDFLYYLNIWAAELDQANAITQRVIEILLQTKDGFEVKGADYRFLSMVPVGGRTVPVEKEGETVFRRQLDYRIECELLIKSIKSPIKQVIVEKVEWEVSEE